MPTIDAARRAAVAADDRRAGAIDEAAAHVPIDEAAAHVHFSHACFERASTLIAKTARSAADDDEMVLASEASLWHWSRRPDCTDRQRAIGCWQLSRVHALCGHADEAMRHALRCDAYGAGQPTFVRARAEEALARAALAAGDTAAMTAHAMRARVIVQGVADEDERAGVLADLAQLGDLARPADLPRPADLADRATPSGRPAAPR